MGKAIQDYNALYSFLRPFIRFSTHCHYYRFIIKGKENLPKDGGYIVAPCHQQALMEPLAVLATTPKPTVFLARADIFEKPLLNSIFTFLKILPVYRIRDGQDKLSKNTAIFSPPHKTHLSLSKFNCSSVKIPRFSFIAIFSLSACCNSKAPL